MRKKIVILSVILFLTLAVAGKSFSWFTSAHSVESSVDMAIVQVETLGESQNAVVKNTGTRDAYVRVRLIPKWSDPSLSVSNAILNINIGTSWTSKQSDGYYYLKQALKPGETTDNIINSISFNSLEEDYEGKSFTVKVVSEGVQTNTKALEDVWGVSSIPSN